MRILRSRWLTASFAAAILLTSLPATAQPPGLTQTRRLEPKGGLSRDEVAVRVVSGKAEWQRGSGDWRTIAVGQNLTVGDRIRTTQAAMLVLELPLEAGFVHVMGGSELGVSELRQLPGEEGPQASTFVLNGGRAFVRLRKFNRERSRFNIQTPGGSAAVRGTEFLVHVDDRHATTVGVSEGLVNVTAQGKAVDVPPGQVTSFAVGEAPALPSPYATVPLKLTYFLPAGDRAKVAGRAAPGSTVMVDGQPVKVAADGSFTATVPLAASATRALIEAMDPTGHVETLTVTAGAPARP